MTKGKINLTRTVVIGFAIIAPLISLALIGTNVFVALAPLFASHLLLLYATLVPNSQWWGPVFSCFATARPEVWLTIDDGPSPEHTIQMLDVLERFGARATFFVVGARAEKYPHLMTEILTHGHAVANHTFTHPQATFWCAGPQRIAREIDRCSETLRNTPERRNMFFRAPVGIKNLFVHPTLAARELALIGWTVRGLDTVRRDSEAVADRVVRGVKPGAIVVLHENHHLKRDAAFGPRCLERTLERLRDRGFECVIPAREQLRTRRAEK
jgi:peptidoglycan/xylan/chitin deacetylase (PgdA/CDA1 family)